MFFVLIAALAAPLSSNASPYDHTPILSKLKPQVAAVLKSSSNISESKTSYSYSATGSQSIPFQLGIERLRSGAFSNIKGKRVGLLTHAAAVDREGIYTIDILRKAPEVNLVALYAPEHGLDGLAKAEQKFDDSNYQGIPVYSLYGDTRKPTPEMLKNIECMVVDLQDIGVRSYTFISAMKYTIQACFERGIPVTVLDRPNPLGGFKVDGPVLDPKFKSYVGLYQIPYVHGLTIGELAQVAREELKPLSGSLTIIKMTGWRRNMLWSDIQPTLKWRATSPSVPTIGAAFGYACTGLGAQLGDFRHGYGTEYPFRFLSHPKLSPKELEKRLNRERLPGFSFEATKIKPGLHAEGEEGVYVRITNWGIASPIALSLSMLQIAQELEGNEPFASANKNNKELFNKHWGRAEPLLTLSSDKRLNAYALSRFWQAEALRWQSQAKKYWLYN